MFFILRVFFFFLQVHYFTFLFYLLIKKNFITPSSKACFCLTLIHHRKPIIIFYIFRLSRMGRISPYHPCVSQTLIISANKEKLLQLL